jgi:hypothetical protein
MSYYIARTVSGPFEAVVADVVERLKAQGFGVLSDIDVQATLKAKLGADMPPYRILGACNPSFAHQALQIEDKLGVLLPCNVIVRDRGRRVRSPASICNGDGTHRESRSQPPPAGPQAAVARRRGFAAECGRHRLERDPP